MQLLVGLGNPGSKYDPTRHNIGFVIIDAIAEAYPFSPFKQKYSGLVSEGMIGIHKVLLFKPQTYMNRSGQAVGSIAQFYKLGLEQITVIHDELNLAVGKMRVKRGGGAGGHNGLKSLDSHLGKDYLRLRFGIDHPGDRDDVSDYVLSPFAKSERPQIEDMVLAIRDSIELLLDGKTDHFMSKVAHQTQPPEIKTKPDTKPEINDQ